MNPILPNQTSFQPLQPVTTTGTPAAGGKAPLRADLTGIARAADGGLKVGDLRGRLQQLSVRVGELERADLQVQKADAALEEVGGLLNELSGLVKQPRDGAEDIAAAQSRIDSLVASIQTAADKATGIATALEIPAFTATPLQPPYTVAFQSEQVEAFRADLPEAVTSALINVRVTAVAQRAGMFLSIGGPQLNLGGPGAFDGIEERFTLNIAGVNGSQELSFASGTTIEDIAAAINSFTDVTGITAQASAQGIRIDGTEYGSNNYGSVTIVDDGNINQAVPNAGIVQLDPLDPTRLSNSPDARTLFSAAEGQTITDFGADIEGTINGVQANGQGRSLFADTPEGRIQLRLSDQPSTGDQANAVILGSLLALRLFSNPPAARYGPQAISELAGQAGSLAINSPSEAEPRIAEAFTETERSRQILASWRAEVLAPQIQSVTSELRSLVNAPREARPLDADRAAALLGLNRPQRPTGN